MKIITDNIQKDVKLISASLSNVEPLQEYFYLNFEQKKVYFFNSDYMGSFKLDLELEDGETYPDNFAIHAKKFLHLCCYYDILYLRDKLLYNSDNEKFQIPTEEYIEDIEMNMNEEIQDAKSINITNKFIKHLRNACHYYEKDFISTLHGIFINNYKLYATDRRKMYIATIDNFDMNINIPIPLVNIFSHIDPTFSVKISNLNDIIWIHINDSLIFKYKQNKNLQAMDVTSNEFKNKFEHDTYIKIDTEQLKEVIRFILPLVDDFNDPRIKLTIDKDKLVFNTTDIVLLERKIEISDSNLDETLEFFLSYSNLKLLQSHIQEHEIKILIDKEMPTLNFIPQNGDQYQIIVCKLQ